MSAVGQRSQPPETHPTHRVHGGIVAALCVATALWVAVDPLTGSHADSTSRLMRSISLLLVSAACAALIVWLIQRGGGQSGDYPATRAFELGYHAGRADALNEQRPSLGVVTTLPSSTGRTGT
jgi:hypothetical protein